MRNPKTTICGIALAVCQAAALVPQIKDYQWAFQGAAIILTALLGVFAADEQKEQKEG